MKLVFFILLFFLVNPVFASGDNVRDYLYSEEYFDYLIDCANQEAIKKKEEPIEQEVVFEENEITAFEFKEGFMENHEPFKIRIQETSSIGAYSETFKKEDTKTIIPVGDRFSFIQDTYKFKNNKYNSDDYRMLAGAEFKLFKNLNLASGLETNYRGFDQNPSSRKLYFTPTLYINDKLSLSFYNKFNVSTREADHDLSVNLSPFKSKVVDFRVYAGLTRYENGSQSKSVNLYTNFYLF